MPRDLKHLSDEQLKEKLRNWSMYNDRQQPSQERDIKRNALQTLKDMIDNPTDSYSPAAERVGNVLAAMGGLMTVALFVAGANYICDRCTDDTSHPQPPVHSEKTAHIPVAAKVPSLGDLIP